MTRQEAIKIIAILKAAFPASFRDLTREQLEGTVSVWQAQFEAIPFASVAWAVDTHIKTAKYAPSISEVWALIKDRREYAYKVVKHHEMFIRQGVPHKLTHAEEFCALIGEQDEKLLLRSKG